MSKIKEKTLIRAKTTIASCNLQQMVALVVTY